MQNMNGKRVVVTGATSGIGRHIATGLARLGADVVLACRDAERAQQVASEIAAETTAAGASRAVLAVMEVDTSSQCSIRAFAQAYQDRYATLDVLVNNAATLRAERQESADGIELVFATNVLGYHLLTAELMKPLLAAVAARVVNVASTFASHLDLEDLQFTQRHYDGMQAYAQSKACNRLLTWALARRFAGSGVTANAMAPGLVPQTSLYRDLPAEIRRGLEQMGGRNIAGGAESAVWLASSADAQALTGKFVEQRKEIPCEFRNDQAEEELWDRCESLLCHSQA